MNNLSEVVKKCLNGWWDFIPAPLAGEIGEVPKEGWLEGQYLVPSFWTKPSDGVRKKGETYYRNSPDFYDGNDYEFLFDAFGYPVEWSRTRAGWMRRNFQMESLSKDRRYFLLFEGIMPRGQLFINGTKVAEHIHPTLPLEVDATEFIHSGDNEIAVFIQDYERDSKGRAKVPTGNWIPCDHSGIWQDVFLVERGEVYLSDITIQTSTREGKIFIEFEVYNACEHLHNITLVPEILRWEKGGEGEVIMKLPAVNLSIEPDCVKSSKIEAEWKDAEWWYPENPTLYQLRTTIAGEDHVIETHYERFGFREVWLEGRDIMLNGYPMHLFSDWGHKTTPYYYTEGWIRQWFQMIRDGNMNHSRLHTHPHPPIILDIADEEGILITNEAGLHGSGGAQASDDPEYWQNAREHIARFVKRDKNHPSVILWSVENEMRWNGNETTLTQEELPKLRKLFNQLDPTRPAYHEGDSSLWNEKGQDIISRHYGKECAGIGWWDQTKPLHCGEMSLYHYAGPNNTLHLGGDRVWAEFKALDESAALDTAYIVETGRTQGVSSFGPWNLSCLENLRMEKEDIKLEYSDFSVPGVKPLQVPAHSSEFEFWKEGKGYTPNHGFEIQKRAFRPLAVIDRSLRTGYFTGSDFCREIFIVNDTSRALEGSLVVSLCSDKQPVYKDTRVVSIGRGEITSKVFRFELLDDLESDVYEYIVCFESNGETLDKWTRKIKVEQKNIVDRKGIQEFEGKIAVVGPGYVKEILETLGVDFYYIDHLEETELAKAQILLMEKDTVIPGSSQNKEVQDFVRKGGRLILMEQTDSLFPTLEMETKPVTNAFVRSYHHEVLNGMREEDFSFWGEDPYPLLSSDSYVAQRMYRKDNGEHTLFLLDSGEGGFGNGSLEYTPLFESQEGKGLILACQLRITDKMKDIPAARQVFINLLKRAIHFEYSLMESPIVVDGSVKEGLDKYIEAAKEGKNIIINGLEPYTLDEWRRKLGIDLGFVDVGDVYQVIRSWNHGLLSGVSNEDTSGIETFSYAGGGAENFRVGTHFFKFTPGLEPMLEIPTQSGLKELMVYGGRTEPLRAHTLSRFLYGERPKTAIALGQVRIGRGSIIFNQFMPPEGQRPRFSRLYNRLACNLGMVFPGSLLDGDKVSDKKVSSPGYPQSVFIYNGECPDSLRKEMVESTIPTLERIVSRPILNIPGWKPVRDRDGIWRADDLDLNRDIYIYYSIHSPMVRKNQNTNLGVPNPEALSFMDMEGEGVVSSIINGTAYGELELGQGEDTLSDIPLEMGENHVLIRWIPLSKHSILKMKWRNIMHQPEVGLRFD